MTLYTISEFSQLIDVSVNTLRRWDKEKILVAGRTATNRRCYTQEQYKNYLLNLEGRTKNPKILKISHKENVSISEEKIYCLKLFCNSLDLQIVEPFSGDFLPPVQGLGKK